MSLRAAIIAMIAKHERESAEVREFYRARAYHKAKMTVASLPDDLFDDAGKLLARLDDGIPTIGSGIEAKIRAVIAGPRQNCAEFAPFSLMGAGPATIAKWGVSSLAGLRREVKAGRIRLTREQELGLKHHADLLLPIPRADVAEICAVFAEIAASIGVQSVPCGSYRRGALKSGDVDIVISPKPRAVDIDVITSIGTLVSAGNSRMKLLVRFRQISRQVDVVFAKPAELGAAVLYFTGSKEFGIALRAAAKRRGLRLNQYGLFDSRGKMLSAGFGEREMFEALRMDYVEPANRM